MLFRSGPVTDTLQSRGNDASSEAPANLISPAITQEERQRQMTAQAIAEGDAIIRQLNRGTGGTDDQANDVVMGEGHKDKGKQRARSLVQKPVDIAGLSEKEVKERLRFTKEGTAYLLPKRQVPAQPEKSGLKRPRPPYTPGPTVSFADTARNTAANARPLAPGLVHL